MQTPPIQPPPVFPPVAPPSFEPPPKQRPQGFFGKLWAGIAALGAAAAKYGFVVFKLLKASKILLTMGSMFVSIWLYSLLLGWKFAVGFVVCIFIHEMGHVFAAWRLKLPVSAPIFIPMMGALIMLKRHPTTAWDGALIGYGGPLFGALSAIGCWALYTSTGNLLFLGLAYLAFMINLFNMMPLYPLDGGRIVGAVSPYIWLAGMAIMIYMVVTGQIRNPMIFVLLILSIPNIWHGLKTGSMAMDGTPATGQQKLVMGLAYVGLCGFLFWGMGETHRQTLGALHQRQEQPQIDQGAQDSQDGQDDPNNQDNGGQPVAANQPPYHSSLRG